MSSPSASASNTSGAKRASSTGRSRVDGVDDLAEGRRATAAAAFGRPLDAELGEHEVDEHRRWATVVERAGRREHGPMPDPEPRSAVTEQPAEAVTRRLDLTARGLARRPRRCRRRGRSPRRPASRSGRRRADPTRTSAVREARRGSARHEVTRRCRRRRRRSRATPAARSASVRCRPAPCAACVAATIAATASAALDDVGLPLPARAEADAGAVRPRRWRRGSTSRRRRRRGTSWWQ